MSTRYDPANFLLYKESTIFRTIQLSVSLSRMAIGSKANKELYQFENNTKLTKHLVKKKLWRKVWQVTFRPCDSGTTFDISE